jgi:hypothetical protein
MKNPENQYSQQQQYGSNPPANHRNRNLPGTLVRLTEKYFPIFIIISFASLFFSRYSSMWEIIALIDNTHARNASIAFFLPRALSPLIVIWLLQSLIEWATAKVWHQELPLIHALTVTSYSRLLAIGTGVILNDILLPFSARLFLFALIRYFFEAICYRSLGLPKKFAFLIPIIGIASIILLLRSELLLPAFRFLDHILR